MRRGSIAGILVALSAVAASGIGGASVAASPGEAAESGIAGLVQEGPTCPVEQYPPSSRCAPRPLSAPIRIRRAGSRESGFVVRSGPKGHFKVRLAPATYVLTPRRVNKSGFPRPPAAFRVTVHREKFTHVTITYDTGIR
jgi:hypothetical protein